MEHRTELHDALGESERRYSRLEIVLAEEDRPIGPVDPNQHTIAFHHTRVDERVFVCGDCWNRLRELSHEVVR